MSCTAAGGLASFASLATSAVPAGTGQKPWGAAAWCQGTFWERVAALSLHERVHQKKRNVFLVWKGSMVINLNDVYDTFCFTKF